jgi:UDP-glucose 4-epimerase
MHTILVTGGLGFIGSETVIALIQAGYEPIVVDDLYNAKKRCSIGLKPSPMSGRSSIRSM